MHAAARASLVLAFALSLIAVVVTPWCTRDRVREPPVWVEAVRESAMVAQGDVVLVHPPWREDVARALRASGAIPAGALVTTALSPRHGEPLPPVVVVSDGSAPLPAALRVRVDAVKERDGIELVRLHARAPTTQLGPRSLLDRMSRAQVELRPLEGSDETVDCAWDPLRARHACAGMPDWLHVGVEELPIGGETVRCAWAHPKTDKVLSVRFPRERLLDTLELSLGITDASATNAAAAPVTAVLRIDGVERGRVTKQPGSRGFAKQKIRVDGAPKDADVDVEITTPDDGQRHACFRLETWTAP